MTLSLVKLTIASFCACGNPVQLSEAFRRSYYYTCKMHSKLLRYVIHFVSGCCAFLKKHTFTYIYIISKNLKFVGIFKQSLEIFAESQDFSRTKEILHYFWNTYTRYLYGICITKFLTKTS